MHMPRHAATLDLKKHFKFSILEIQVAERQGFEPWVGLHPQRFSRPPRSTAPAPLRRAGRAGYLIRQFGARHFDAALSGPLSRFIVQSFFIRNLPDERVNVHLLGLAPTGHVVAKGWRLPQAWSGRGRHRECLRGTAVGWPVDRNAVHA